MPCCATSAATPPPPRTWTSTCSRFSRRSSRKGTRKSPRAAVPSRGDDACSRQRLAAQALQRLGEDGLTVGVGAAFLHVGQVSLVGLDTRRGRRGRLVLARGGGAARALPLVGNRGVGRETRPGLVAVGAPERHPDTGRGFAALRLAHRAGAYPATANRVTTTHKIPPPDEGPLTDERAADP